MLTGEFNEDLKGDLTREKVLEIVTNALKLVDDKDIESFSFIVTKTGLEDVLTAGGGDARSVGYGLVQTVGHIFNGILIEPVYTTLKLLREVKSGPLGMLLKLLDGQKKDGRSEDQQQDDAIKDLISGLNKKENKN